MENAFYIATCRFHVKEKDRLLITGYFLDNRPDGNRIEIRLDGKKLFYTTDGIRLHPLKFRKIRKRLITKQFFLWIQGLSRSGTTIATGLLLGNKKAAVAQFSFLMVLAPILGETLLEAASGDLTAGIATGTLAAGFAASFITGCLACKFMIEIVKRGKLIWFSLYCALAGLVSILSYFC